ncbi:hypothetical protein [Fodinibius saliphilus]|uniref:hypothetical protein n=1 Tax=Fodinibius saliphilus TaxID=1920650 RepID=UPI0014860B33|nr:hypothetical protein [Fodinibius saliphilus]
MHDCKKLENLNLTELTPQESKSFEGGSTDTGVWDDPNDPDDGGCIPDPFRDLLKDNN